MNVARPTHHVDVHLFDTLTSHTITNAKVEMSYQPRGEKEILSGNPVHVPILVLQDMGKGEESIHYGNNVAILNVPYVVSVTVNGTQIKFKLDNLFEPSPSTDYMRPY